MAVKTFNYLAVNGEGKRVKGQIKSSDKKDAKKSLQSQLGVNSFVLKINPVGGLSILTTSLSTPKITKDDALHFTGQLQSLFISGLPIIDCLEVIKSMYKKKNLKDWVQAIIDDIKAGKSFSKTCEDIPGFYADAYIALLKAGEASGALGPILKDLFELMNWEKGVKKKLLGAFRYPALVMGIAFSALIGVFTLIIPKFSAMLTAKNQSLPVITQIMLNISETFTQNWMMMILTTGFVSTILATLYFWEPARKVIDKNTFRIPVIGQLLKDVTISRFSKIFAILYTNGVPIVTSLSILQDLYNNRLYQTEIAFLKSELEKGKSLGESSSKTYLFEGLVSQMLGTGEKSGNIGFMMQKNSEIYADQVDNLIENFFGLMEPLIIGVIGILILCLALGIFLPMVNAMKAVGS